jgi:hypothetical protein
MGISNISNGWRPGICTSTTRPTAPYEGQMIYETDTNQVLVYDGSYWISTSPQRNLLINGAMQVAQRATSVASITTAGYRTADRWNFNVNALGTWTQSVENDAPTGSGFRKSLKMLCTTADASPAAGDYCIIRQVLEGQNVQSIKKGTSSAEQITVSFWVKSNVTGTYILELLDADNSRQVSKSYTVSASGTWEFKSLTFPADTTGAFDNDNALSLECNFWLATGSTYSSGTLNTSWASTTSANRVVGQTNVAAATNNYWQITGVQMDVGANASPFEFKDYGRELLECQRYYFKTDNTNGVSTSNVYHRNSFPVVMRARPTISYANGAGSFVTGNVGTDGFYAVNGTTTAYDFTADGAEL